MMFKTKLILLLMVGLVAACGTRTGTNGQPTPGGHVEVPEEERDTIWDLFSDSNPPDTTIAVNKYLWTASLEVLNFLPIQTVDPFTGVIATGYGTPPGGGRAYRATIFVQDPALDARSLRVALHSRSGPVSDATARSVEDAILTRARQLRIRAGGL